MKTLEAWEIDSQKPLSVGQVVRIEVGYQVYIDCTVLESIWSREWNEYTYHVQPLSGSEPIMTWGSRMILGDQRLARVSA